MSEHHTKIIGGNGMHQGKCTCGAQSKTVDYRWIAEDWVAEHMALVQKVRTHLTTRSPSLTDQRDYYRTMQLNPETPPGDVPLWRQLADEIEHRMGKPVTDQEPLPFE